MIRTLLGIAAVLHQPMRGKPVMFGDPGRFPLDEDAPIVYRRARVGEVQALWIEADRVHWIGRLDEEPFPYVEDLPADQRIPIPEPSMRHLISGGRLVGVPALTGARTERVDGCTALAGWTVSGMQLLTLDAAPWADLELNLR